MMHMLGLAPAVLLCAGLALASIAAIRAGATREKKAFDSYGPSDVYTGVAMLAFSILALCGLWARW